jgi:acyl transferase domain-containing protein
MQPLQDFDPAPFGLSDKEGIMVDPQQRMLLQAAAELMFASQGGTARGLDSSTSSAGVFVGISNPDYGELKKAHTPIGVYSATGTGTAVLELRGPCNPS